MIIGDDYVFISVPKAGTHTMYFLLSKFGGNSVPGTSYHYYDVPAEDAEKFRFSIVRNPYSRTVSAWYALTTSEMYRGLRFYGLSLIQFIEQIAIRPDIVHPASRSQLLTLHGQRLDRILKIENLTEDFRNLPFVGHHVDIPVLLRREHLRPPWQELVTAEVKALIDEIYEEDFEAFDYFRSIS